MPDDAFVAGLLQDRRGRRLNAIGHQQTYGRFHYAICIAIDQLYNHRTVVEGQNDFRISIGSLNNNANRKFLRQIVEAIFGERVYLECSSVKIHS